MESLGTIIKVYPFFALGLAVALMEFGRHFRRKDSKLQWIFFGIVGFLGFTSLVWIVMRGDKHAGEWVKIFFDSNLDIPR